MATVHLADYRPAPQLLERTDLSVALHADHALVDARLAFRPNPASQPGPLLLQGVGLQLLELRLNGQPLPPGPWCSMGPLDWP